MDYIDLHVHSSASDGTMSPTEVVHYAIEKGLYAFALTDHDTVDGLKEAYTAVAASNHRVKLIPGIEISSTYNDGDLHILGLGIDYKDTEFLKGITKCRNSRDIRNKKIIMKLNECGVPVTEETINLRYGDVSITRAHYARYLMDKGYVKSIKEAFDKYLKAGAPCYVPREYITPQAAIKLILDAGGQPVLAHPILYHLMQQELDSLVAQLKSLGLMGIEAIYSTYTNEQENFVKSLAKKHSLFITGGSDFHGTNKSDIDLMVGRGNLRVPKEIYPYLP